VDDEEGAGLELETVTWMQGDWENIILARCLCHMAIKVFRKIFTTAMCTITAFLDDSNLNAFQSF